MASKTKHRMNTAEKCKFKRLKKHPATAWMIEGPSKKNPHA